MNAQTERVEQDLTYYHAALKGERVPILADKPEAGYYRHGRDAILIRADKGGELIMKRNGRPHTSAILDTWMYCAGKPIEFSVYEHRLKHGRWPEEDAKIAKSEELSKAMGILAEGFKSALENDVKDQSQADILAGYIQQGRALIKEAKEVLTYVTAPVSEELEELKKRYGKPSDEIDALNKKALAKLGDFGIKSLKKANDPDFKWAAGKAGEGKTIALKKDQKFEIEDEELICEFFDSNEDVAEEIAAASKAIILKYAAAAYKKDGKDIPGLKVINTFKAV